MMRYVYLAVGPLLVIAVGAWLVLSLPEEDIKDSAKISRKTDSVSLPSGLGVELQEMLRENAGQGLIYRFRFVAPDFEQTEDVESVVADLEYLCTRYALPRLENAGPAPGQIIISLSDKPSEFGQYHPDVVQVFEAFRVEDGACIWEMF